MRGLGWEIEGYGDLGLLGRGGFATVYRARQIAFDREVAVKVLDAAATDDRTVAMFTRECRAAGALSWHPHVVPVYDAGRTSLGSPYLAMELLPGGSLEDLLDGGGAMSPSAAIAATLDVADALAAAHQEGLLHRDVKPANVLIDRLGRARLTDFGIARVSGAGSATTSGVVGTLAFMAPEVLGGGTATPASDVYALGLTLVTLLAGRNPYAADTDESPFAVIARIMSGRMPMPDTVPLPLRPLVESWTSPVPEDRPPTANEARDSLAAATSESRTRGQGVPPPASEGRTHSPHAPSSPPEGWVTRAAKHVPAPPASAVRVRADHTLAVPPPPPDQVDDVEYDLSEWPWGLERRLLEHLAASGVAYEHRLGSVQIAHADQIQVDNAVEAQLETWATAQRRFGAAERRLLRSSHKAARRLQQDTWDAKATIIIEEAAERIDTMGAPQDVEEVPWRVVTLAVAALRGVLEDARATDDLIRRSATVLADSIDSLDSTP